MTMGGVRSVARGPAQATKRSHRQTAAASARIDPFQTPDYSIAGRITDRPNLAPTSNSTRSSRFTVTVGFTGPLRAGLNIAPHIMQTPNCPRRSYATSHRVARRWLSVQAKAAPPIAAREKIARSSDGVTGVWHFAAIDSAVFKIRKCER